MKKNAKSKIWVWATAATLAAAMGAGCKSIDTRESQVKESSDAIDHNRLLVRLAMAENVYNGIAAERAVYPKDFDPGCATLNRLGTRRVETIVDASRDSTGRVVVVRGDAPDALYAARVAAVREELADAGLNPEEVPVATDTPVGGGGVSSDRALLTYSRMLS
ncbi:MAG: hypothetical protein ABIP55_02640, partial [Tepidisphaeraceae bacterium]